MIPVSGLPTIYHLFAERVSSEQRSRAFSYLAAFGAIGQTFAAAVSFVAILPIFAHAWSMLFGMTLSPDAKLYLLPFQACPHFDWRFGFYLFGGFGFLWCLLWIKYYEDPGPALPEQSLLCVKVRALRCSSCPS